jgi:gamma-glutamylcyclotransferase (GGCT)/AIG2-like uncharacterized protein YtfP
MNVTNSSHQRIPAACLKWEQAGFAGGAPRLTGFKAAGTIRRSHYGGVTSPHGPYFMRLPVSIEFDGDDLDTLLEVNALRAAGRSQRLEQLEERVATRFHAHCRLAVYGSLAPGRSNHHQLQDLRGEWHSGCIVHGDLADRGWGAGLGYPALRWSTSGPAVPVELLVCDELPGHWPRLDEFEGPDYLRIIVPVFSGAIVVAVANLYAAR